MDLAALAQAKAQMDEGATSVRDEIGFLTIHQRYANMFFPGTSVLHTRVRYAIFVPWHFEDIAGLAGAAAIQELRNLECELAGRLKQSGEEGVIGGRVHPDPSSQPPSSTYWNALVTWGILRTPAGRSVSRADVRWLSSFRLSRRTGAMAPLPSA